MMMLIAALTASLVTNGGRSAWFVGVLLLMVYLIFAMTCTLPPRRNDLAGRNVRRDAYLMPMTIESGPTSCSTRVDEKPAPSSSRRSRRRCSRSHPAFRSAC